MYTLFETVFGHSNLNNKTLNFVISTLPVRQAGGGRNLKNRLNGKSLDFSVSLPKAFGTGSFEMTKRDTFARESRPLSDKLEIASLKLANGNHSDPEGVWERKLHNLIPSWDHVLLILRKYAQDDFFKRVSFPIALILILLLTQTAFAQTATAPTGTGTSGDPYLISSLENLYWLSQVDSVWNDNAYFQQTADIDASATSGWDAGAGFSPIGTDVNEFNGSYNGDGYIISNLFINRPTFNSIGLFGAIQSTQIANLGLIDVDITGASQTGGLFGEASSGTTITACYTTGTVNGNTEVGGIGGFFFSTTTNANNYSSATVSGTSDDVGGLFGKGEGIAINDSYSSGSINGDENIGGLIGNVFGISNSRVLRSFTTGSVNGTSFLGGLIGSANSMLEITDSYASGSVSGTTFVGGLIGVNDDTDITTSYSMGSVSGSSSTGGLIGFNSNSTLTSTYWDTETSGQSDGIGFDNNGQSPTGLTSAEARRDTSFTGFDFTSTWGIMNGFTGPYLQQFPPDSVNGVPFEDYIPSGSGTSGDPYLISSLENLYWLSQSDTVWNDSAYYQQTTDIDASPTTTWDDSAGFSPIGSFGNEFVGNYDGDGHTISNLFINRPGQNQVGLFGAVNNSELQNLGLPDVQVTGGGRVGALFGLTNGSTTITNSYSSGTVTGGINTGGLGGSLNTDLVASSNYSSASVSSSGSSSGGLFGNAVFATITDSYATGPVIGLSSLGGLVGDFAGGNVGSMERSFATGSVNGTSDVGGLIGFAASVTEITDSYATGSVSGTANAGGLIGNNLGNPVNTSYANGSVSGSGTMGGLIGSNSFGGTVTSSFWDTQTSGQASGIGFDDNSQSPTGLTSAQMQYQSNFSGFDFATSWGIVNGFSEPYLQNFAPDSVAGYPIAWFPAGEGTSGDPYQIATLDNLFILSQEESLWDADFIQTANIDASPTAAWDDSAGFSPIGRESINFRFEGTYKGKGHTISGLTINRPTQEYIGLFGDVRNASIDSLNLIDLNITALRIAGGLAGRISLTDISYIFTSGTIIVDHASGTSSAGGIAGDGGGDQQYLFSSVNITANGIDVGGIFGRYSSGALTDSYATGDVSGTANVGGLIGIFGFGDSGEALHRVYATGAVSGTNDVGGLIGDLDSGIPVTNCYATGSVQGSGNDIGGLVGIVSSSASISNCYASGSVSGSSDVGAFIGENDGNVTNSYWNTQTSGQANAIGNDTNGQTVTGLTVQEMAQQSSFSGFDFSSTWGIVNAFSEPYLQFNTPDSLSGFALGDFPTGAGIEGDPILISNLTHLEALSQSSSAWGSVFLQTADIDASATSGWNSGSGFIPIGESLLPFKGDYDGGGHSISNLFIVKSFDTGFFGRLDSASVSNLKIIDANITGSTSIGILAGNVGRGSIVRNIYASGSLSAGNDSGGLIGVSSADSVYQVYSNAHISGGSDVGGLIGALSRGIVIDSYATGSVSGTSSVGGLIGFSGPLATISNTYSSASVEGSETEIGGFIGEVFFTTLINNYWNTNLSGQSNGIGSGSGGVTGLTTAQMIDSTHFPGLDFSATGAWNMDDGFSFPYLRALEEHRMVVATIDSSEGWRMIGNPGDVTYAELLDPVFTQGYEGSDGGTGFASNVYFYEETTQSWTVPSKANDYFGKADSNSVNTALNGILLYVYGDDDGDGNEDPWPKYLVSENNTLNESFSVSLNYTNTVSEDSAGWNLISNPYPVALDWEQVITNGENINTLPVAYVWVDSLFNGNGAYKIHYGYPLPPGLNSDVFFDGAIPAMQAFWVKSIAANPALSFNPAYQTNSTRLYKPAPAEDSPELSWLTLSVAHQGFSNEITLFSTQDEQAHINVPKLSTLASRYVEVAIQEKESDWVARTIPQNTSDTHFTYPIQLSSTESGTFTFEWKGLDSFGADWKFELIDHLTGESISLSEGDTYSFELEAGSAAKKSPLENNELPLLRRGLRGGSVSANELGATSFELRITVGTLVSEEPEQDLPVTYALAQNYPNPFNPSTNIQFELPESGNVELLVFDILGRQVATLVDDRMEAGYHEIRFNARNLASGVYLYQLRAGGTVLTKKLTLIK